VQAVSDRTSTLHPTAVRVDRQQAVAAVWQLVLLAALWAGVGLGPAGWMAGAAYGAGLWALLARAARRAGTAALGPADLVTLGRATLVGGVTALVADGLAGAAVPAGVLVVLATVALALDAVDGQVARRTGTASELGARFDMEVDAFLVLVLSVHAAAAVGPWAPAIGAMRYAFLAASLVLPWLRGSLPTRYSAKAVAVVQGVVLVAVSAAVLPPPLAVALVAAALALLVWSFGQSVVWLWRHAR
jgi:phosphatidylglycerophosphate synthase